jgi:hypothetical protein
VGLVERKCRWQGGRHTTTLVRACQNISIPHTVSRSRCSSEAFERVVLVREEIAILSTRVDFFNSQATERDAVPNAANVQDLPSQICFNSLRQRNTRNVEDILRDDDRSRGRDLWVFDSL